MNLFRIYKFKNRQFRVTSTGNLEENIKRLDPYTSLDDWRKIDSEFLTETWELIVDELTIKAREDERVRISTNIISNMVGH